MAGAITRLAWTSDDAEHSSMIRIHSSSTIGVVAKAPNTIDDHHARWLRKGLEDGLERLGRTPEEKSVFAVDSGGPVGDSA